MNDVVGIWGVEHSRVKVWTKSATEETGLKRGRVWKC